MGTLPFICTSLSVDPKFLQRFNALHIRPTSQPHFERWADLWIKADGPASTERTKSFPSSDSSTTHGNSPPNSSTDQGSG